MNVEVGNEQTVDAPAALKVGTAERELAVALQERDELRARLASLSERLADLSQVEAEALDIRRREQELRDAVAEYDAELNRRGVLIEQLESELVEARRVRGLRRLLGRLRAAPTSARR